MKMVRASNTSEVFFLLVDDEDYERVRARSWYFDREHGRVTASIKNRTVSIQQFLLDVYDSPIDHIDRNPLNNQKSNYRIVTVAQNNANRGFFRSNSSGFKGVFKGCSKIRPWRAAITANNVRICLGNHETPEQAAAAYDRAAVEHFGEFACTNQMLGLL